MNLPFNNWEILLYCLCAVVPCVVTAVITFMEDRIYSVRKTWLLALFCVAIRTIINFAYFYSPKALGFVGDLAGGLVYFTFLVWMVRAPAMKLLFFLLAFSDFSNFFIIMGKHVESMFSVTMAMERYRWSFSLCLLAVEAVSLPVLYILFFRPFADLSEKDSDTSLWNYLWLAPMTFYFIWILLFYAFPTNAFRRAVGNAYWFCKLLIDIGSLIIYRLMLMLVQDNNDKIHLQKMAYAQEQQLIQYNSLVDRMDMVRAMRHNIRHHLGALRQYSEEGKRDEILTYVDGLMGTPTLKAPMIYCKNIAGNAVLQYYAYRAANLGICCDIRVAMPEEFFVESTDISVMIGNLFANAIEAVAREDIEGATITVKGRPQSDSIYIFVMENPSALAPETDARGRLLSHHHAGPGIGLASVASIAKKYDGRMETDVSHGFFRVSVMLLNHASP
ncbi:MAG: GHKL domain-containing protein [Lachnospiraceae bacterium]|nr:GHKL domain-containing protein [Lachnospiraceae bacterium]